MKNKSKILWCIIIAIALFFLYLNIDKEPTEPKPNILQRFLNRPTTMERYRERTDNQTIVERYQDKYERETLKDKLAQIQHEKEIARLVAEANKMLSNMTI